MNHVIWTCKLPTASYLNQEVSSSTAGIRSTTKRSCTMPFFLGFFYDVGIPEVFDPIRPIPWSCTKPFTKQTQLAQYFSHSHLQVPTLKRSMLIYVQLLTQNLSTKLSSDNSVPINMKLYYQYVNMWKKIEPSIQMLLITHWSIYFSHFGSALAEPIMASIQWAILTKIIFFIILLKYQRPSSTENPESLSHWRTQKAQEHKSEAPCTSCQMSSS